MIKKAKRDNESTKNLELNTSSIASLKRVVKRPSTAFRSVSRSLIWLTFFIFKLFVVYSIVYVICDPSRNLKCPLPFNPQSKINQVKEASLKMYGHAQKLYHAEVYPAAVKSYTSVEHAVKDIWRWNNEQIGKGYELIALHVEELKIRDMLGSYASILDGVNPMIVEIKKTINYITGKIATMPSLVRQSSLIPVVVDAWNEVMNESTRQLNHLREIWHDASVYTVYHGIPLLRDEIIRTQSWYAKKIHPTIQKYSISTARQMRKFMGELIMHMFNLVRQIRAAISGFVNESGVWKQPTVDSFIKSEVFLAVVDGFSRIGQTIQYISDRTSSILSDIWKFFETPVSNEEYGSVLTGTWDSVLVVIDAVKIIGVASKDMIETFIAELYAKYVPAH